MYNQIFIESKFYPTSYLSEFDLNFLKSKDLITITGQIFQSNFVGEVITPEMSFFSVPKNFGTDEETINITKKALETFRKLDKKSKTLILNDEFTTSSSGELQSEKFYYDKLKEYFLDYITYEFIYPEKPIKIHSSTPIKGKIDVLSTIRNRDRTGSGITYKVKNLKNDPEWNLDDIYYSTIKYLTDKWATQEEKDKIHRMFLFLKEKEYDIKEIDISDNQEIITKINKCSVSGIHNPIKTTLLNYFKSLSVTKKFKLNIVYTKLFQNVWERIIQISLYHNQDFENSLISNFTNVETHSRWVSSSELENLFKTNPGYRI